MHDSKVACHSCGNTELELIISFGETPLADGLLREEQLDQTDYMAPSILPFVPTVVWYKLQKSFLQKFSSVGTILTSPQFHPL